MERSEYNRIRQLNSMIKLVNDKMTDKDNHKNFIQSLGVSDKKFQQVVDGVSTRFETFPKKVNDIISVFVENEYAGAYNIDRILQGKVKAFPGKTPKQRIINALEQAKDFHG